MGMPGGYWFSKATPLIPLFLIIPLFTASAGGVKHIVGGAIWSIPPSVNFYTNWSTSQTFYTGDVLYFDFESEMYSVHEVGRAEYGYCESTHPKNTYEEGPALVTLSEVGRYNFLCPMLDYCSQGLKIYVTVSRSTASTPPVRVP